MAARVGAGARADRIVWCVLLAGAAVGPAWGQEERVALSGDGTLTVRRSGYGVRIEEGAIPKEGNETRYQARFVPLHLALSADKVVVLVSGSTRAEKTRARVRKVEVARLSPKTERLASFEIEDVQIASVAIAPHGASIAVATESRVLLYDAKTGKELARVRLSDEVAALCYSSDGKTLVVGDESGRVRACEVKTGKERWQGRPHKGVVRAVVFSPDGKTIASCSEDGAVCLTKADSGAAVQRLAGHRKTVAAVAFSHDGAYLASIGYDRRLITWDLGKGEQYSNLTTQSGLYPSLAFTSDRSVVLTFGGSRRVFDSAGKLVHLCGLE